MPVKELFVEQLRDLYSAENQLIKALPKMAKGASTKELKMLIQDHLEETKEQAERLKQIFHHLGEKPTGEECKAMQGLVEEGSEQLENWSGDECGDLAIIGASIRVELYETAGYATAISLGKALGNLDAVELLKQTFEEEKQAAKNLEQTAKPLLAKAVAGSSASGEHESEEEEETEGVGAD